MYITMKLTKYIIRGKVPNYNQTVYCSVGEVPDDRNSVLLGYHESLPVMLNKSACVTTPPKKATLKVEVDPNTGNRFIHLNGKRLRMLCDTEIPLHIKQKVKINAPTPIVAKEDISSSSKTLWGQKENISNSAKESHVYISNKNGANSLSQSSLIINTKLIKVENPQADAIPQTTDNTQINSDKHSNSSSTLNAASETVKKFIIQPIDKMQPIDLTKHDKCIGTDRKNCVDAEVQVNIEINESHLLDEFDRLNPYFDLDDILKFDRVLESRPPTPRKITNSPFPNVPTKQLTNLNTVLQQGTEKQKLAASFFAELRRALIKDDKGNMPIHVGVLTNNLALVRRSWFILKILKQSVDVLNNNDYTPLQLAIIHKADDNIVTLLAAAEAHLDYCDSEGNNIIHLAVEFQRTDALKMLLNYVTNVAILDQHNHEGLSPLMMCALSNQLQCADLLLDTGADINLRDQVSGRTALFHAAENMHQDMVQLLLNYGADTKIKNFFGTSPHDAMYDVEDIPEAIKLMILGRSMKRKFVEDVKNSHKLKKIGTELKTYSRLKKIGIGNGQMDDVLKRGTVIQIRHVLNG